MQVSSVNNDYSSGMRRLGAFIVDRIALHMFFHSLSGDGGIRLITIMILFTGVGTFGVLMLSAKRSTLFTTRLWNPRAIRAPWVK